MLEPPNYNVSSKGSITSRACRWKDTNTLDPVKNVKFMNLQKPHYINLHQDITHTPQDYISIDLTGPHNTTSQGNLFALTVVCNLTGYLMTTSISDKKRATVAIHLILEIMLKFGYPGILHSDYGTEFKSKLIEHLSQQLSIKTTYIPLTTPRLTEN